MRRALRRTLLLSGVVAAVLSAPATAIAHPLGNFTVNRHAGIELTPGEVRIEYVLDMAEIPTVQVRPESDNEANATITDPERAAGAARTAPELLANLTLTVDRRAVPLDVVSSSMWFRPGQGGLEILRLEATFAGPGAWWCRLRCGFGRVRAGSTSFDSRRPSPDPSRPPAISRSPTPTSSTA